jgi:hypothetical protein
MLRRVRSEPTARHIPDVSLERLAFKVRRGTDAWASKHK